MYIKYIAGFLLSIKKGYNFKCVIFIQNPFPHLQQEWTGLRISLKARPPLNGLLLLNDAVIYMGIPLLETFIILNNLI